MKFVKQKSFFMTMQLSTKQKEFLDEVTRVKEDHKEIDEDYLKSLSSNNIPMIFAPCNRDVTLNYQDYLRNCKLKTAKKLNRGYNLEPFIEAIDEISNNEIILYRSELENRLQDGLHALMEIQFLDSLVILRKENCTEKLGFDLELKNIMFLMKQLVIFFDLNPPTVANEIYMKEKIKVTNECNIDSRYKSPEYLENMLMNIKLSSLSYGLAKQHSCLIDVNVKKKGNIYKYLKLF